MRFIVLSITSRLNNLLMLFQYMLGHYYCLVFLGRPSVWLTLRKTMQQGGKGQGINTRVFHHFIPIMKSRGHVLVIWRSLPGDMTKRAGMSSKKKNQLISLPYRSREQINDHFFIFWLFFNHVCCVFQLPWSFPDFLYLNFLDHDTRVMKDKNLKEMKEKLQIYLSMLCSCGKRGWNLSTYKE